MDFDVLRAFFHESLDACNEGPTDFDLAIANSVVWACALDEALSESLGEDYERARDADRQGCVLLGLRLARNAILHGQTFALGDGRWWPGVLPVDIVGPRTWLSYELLTETWKPRNRGPGLERLRVVYEREVAGTDIGTPLWNAREWLNGVAERGWAV